MKETTVERVREVDLQLQGAKLNSKTAVGRHFW